MATNPSNPPRMPGPVDEKLVACEVCLTEIPKTVAKSVEASDYVHHFCGLDCMQKWRAQGGAEAERG